VLARTRELYLGDCFARKTAARCDDYARHLELSPQHLARQVGRLGLSPRDFLRAGQLQRAEHLLRTTSYSIVEIAVMSAFGTHPAFYRAFRAAYGVTPGQYRNRFRNEHAFDRPPDERSTPG
jgi:AraC-like DNA-binding protein